MDLTYAYDFDHNRIKAIWSKTFNQKNDIKYDYYEGAWIIPKRGNSGGMLDADLNEIEQARLYYGDNHIFGQKYPFNDESTNDFITGDVIYLGPFRNHWGHFLIDNVPRLHTFRSFPHATYAFCVTPDFDAKTVLPQIIRFFELLGINRNQLAFINRPTRIEKSYINEPSYWLYKYYSSSYLDIFKFISDKIKPTLNIPSPKKVFFSKSGSKNSLNYIGVEILEHVLSQKGFEIYYPENLSLDDQIHIIRNCREYAFLGGTLAHNTLFGIGKKIKAYVLTRHHFLERALFESLKMSQAEPVICDFYLSPFPIHWTTAPVAFAFNENLKKFIFADEITPVDNYYFSSKYQATILSKYILSYIKSIHSINYDKDANLNPSDVSFISQGHLFSFLKLLQNICKDGQANIFFENIKNDSKE